MYKALSARFIFCFIAVLAFAGMGDLLVSAVNARQDVSNNKSDLSYIFELNRAKNSQHALVLQAAITHRLDLQDYQTQFDEIHKLYNIVASAIDSTYLRQASDQG